MGVSRRDFMKLSGGTVLLGSLGVNLDPAKAYAKDLRIKDAKETTTICPYCSVGCGIIVYAEDGKVINTEGDPDHPINEGALCSKGASHHADGRTTTRASRNRCIASPAERLEGSGMGLGAGQNRTAVKDTRDKSFKTTSKVQGQGKTTRRHRRLRSRRNSSSTGPTPSPTWAAPPWTTRNATCSRNLSGPGAWCISNTRPVSDTSATVAALGESFGRGAMTNHWIDLKNADVILIMGGNPASNHPISMKWIMKAREKGAKLICRRPPLHADRGQGRSLRPPPFRHGHRLPGRDDQVHPRQQPLLQGVRRQLHQRLVPGESRTSRCPARPGRPLLRVRREEAGSTTRRPGPSRWTRTG